MILRPPSVPPHLQKASENRSRLAGAKQACEQWTLTLWVEIPFSLKNFP
jgi:hypothetical protein